MANYDPGKIVINFKGHLIRGYAAGTFVNVEREVQSFTKSTGADGKVTRVRSRNKSGMITLTLQAESPSNAILSAALISDELLGLNEGPVEVADLLGGTICSSGSAWVARFANVEYADAATNREWIIECAELDMFVDGANDA